MPASAATISCRHGIAWASNTITEPTSTIVLSSPSGLFVDIRLTLNESMSISYVDEASKTILPKQPSVRPNSDFLALEWAFAGKATYSSAAESGKRTATWDHWIDSKSEVPDGDSGELKSREDGTIVETGSMKHPETGIVTPYTEIWVDEEVETAQQEQDLKTTAKGSYVVVQCQSHDTQTRGLIVWAGGYCQGIVRNGKQVEVERWEYDENGKGGHGEWVRMWRSDGDLTLPCGWILKQAENLRQGIALSIPNLGTKDGKWIVTETDFKY
jgi:Protein HRI1